MNGRILVIGGGGDLGRKRILPALAQLGVAADLVDPRAVPGEGLPGVVKAFSSLAEVSSPGPYLGAVVATPNHLHLMHCRWVLETARLPCLVEKPIAHTLNDANAMSDLAANSPVPLWVSDHYLAKPASIFLFAGRSRLLKEIGPLCRIRGRLMEDPGTLAGRDWLRMPELSGGGVWIDTGIHLVTVLLALLPEKEWQATCAQGVGYEPDNPDLAETSFAMTAISGDVSVELKVGKASGAQAKELVLEGVDGSLRIDWLTDTVQAGGAALSGPEPAPFGGYLTLMEAFIASCREPQAPPGPGLVHHALALRALKLVKDAYAIASIPAALRDACLR